MKAIVLLAASTLLAVAPELACAQKFPTKPVRIVTVGPGSQSDTVARLITPKMSEAWGQPVVIENRPGAGGAMAASIVAKAAPDGHTLLLQSSQFAVGAAVHQNLPYDAVRDFAGVTQLGYSTVVFVVPPSLGVKSMKDFLAYARAKPVPVLYSSSGAGSGVHITCERFRLVAGIKAQHVGFKSSPEAVLEVVAGRVQFSIPSLAPALPFIKDNRLIALAVGNPQRLPLLPDVPTLKEVVPGFERDGSFGVLAPRGTPKPVLDQIAKEIARALAQPDVKERLQAMGFVPDPTTPEAFDRIVRNDIATFAKVAKAAGLTKTEK